MSYLVLARKYRPQQFEDLVGQLPVSQTLQNALESGRIAHAYVFSGPRGVGKTTTARLLAKCLNCVKGPTLKPCNECPSCVSIAKGNSVQDVLEIDGASNRGIEQIRELRESAKYTPSSSRYRIYIIDEAHQITKDAFGALLKTLEEPPEHVVFMMATTEVQKIPAPILSRCQRFSLRPVAPELVLKHLKEICQKEKVKVEEAALADIVRFVEGSVRDALSLLDQAIVFSPEGITSQTLKDLLGILPREVIRETSGCIAKGDPTEILKLISQSIKNGIDLTQLAKDLQEYYHTLLLIKAGVEDVFQSDLKTLQKETASIDFPTLERNIRLLSRAQDEMRRSETPRAVFEIYALKLGQKTIDPKILIERLEKMEGRHPTSPPDVILRTPKATEESHLSLSKPQRQDPSPLAQDDKSMRGNPRPSATALKEPPVTAANIQNGWANFVNTVAEQKVSLAAALEEAAVTVRDNQIILTFHKQFNQQLVIRSMEVLAPLLMTHFGPDVSIETKLAHTVSHSTDAKGTIPHPASKGQSSLSAKESEKTRPEEGSRFEEVAPADIDEQIRKVMQYFPGTLKKEKKFS